jgi:23S rRNA (uracil1939-C5)-methyltransferase
MKSVAKAALKIESLAFGGDGVAHLEDGRAVFVSGAAPGDQVSAEIIESKKTYARARALEVLKPGPGRVKAPCPVAGSCGGCQWQHLGYPAQLEAKQDFVLQALRRIGGFENPPLKSILAADNPWSYRNKAILPVQEGEFGFYREGSHDIVPLPEIGCGIQAAGNEVLAKLRPQLKNFTSLKHVALRSNSAGEILLGLVTGAALPVSAKAIASSFMAGLPKLKGVLNNVQPKATNVVLGSETRVLAGEEYLVEELGGLKFRLSLASFFQVNAAQTLKLWEMLKSARDWKGTERILELYCGVGTLSLPLARLGASLLGVEIFEGAVADARVNAQMNGLKQARFETADAAKGFEFEPKPDLVVLDPPRKGLSPELLSLLASKKPKEILYVSCDPSSLARDLKFLVAAGASLNSVQPLDMFPQTYHVESLARLLF